MWLCKRDLSRECEGKYRDCTDCVLDRIRAEIDSYCGDNRDRNDGLYIAMKIIDKYQASPTGVEG